MPEPDPVAADAPVRSALEEFGTALSASYSNLTSDGPLPVDGTEVSEALLRRLASFYSLQQHIKTFLDKRYMTAGADFFVESLLFYLHAFLQTHHIPLLAASERTVARRRGAMRPDITLWDDGTCVAFIECKTQLGWKRGRWAADFENRELKIAEDHIDARGYLVVMTEDNWSGFGNDPRLGNQLFVLARPWPSAIDWKHLDDALITPIEGLFRQIGDLVQQPKPSMRRPLQE